MMFEVPPEVDAGAASGEPPDQGGNSQQAASVFPPSSLAAAGTKDELALELATVRKHLAELQHSDPIPGNEGRREWSIAVARRQVRELERMLAA